MSEENLELSSQTIDSIARSMPPEETRQQMIARRLREGGVFSHLKFYGQPLPELPTDSGLKVESAGIIFDFPDMGIVDSFIVYDPRRIEVRIQRNEDRPFRTRRGRVTQVYRESPTRDDPNEGWITPFPKSRGRVVSYRDIQRPGQP
jgi:hypothetical protein